jgi:2-desacetyl-2-hydroxyethyl bacteriochlorophyllide A dehydrogenase
MRAVVISEPGKVEIQEKPDPEPSAGEVLVRVRACGICGTDVHIFKGEYLGEYPIIPGHEFAGTVEAVGEGVTAFRPGEHVAVEPNICCDKCRMCLINEENFCENWQAIGVTRPGAMADLVVAPEKNVFDIGPLNFKAGAFMEPLSCVLHGVEKLQVRSGDRTLIIGAGPIGCLLLQTMLARGAGETLVADLSDVRLQKAKELGASEAVNTSKGWEPVEELGNGGYDIVIEAAGVAKLTEKTVDLARPGGQILWFGVTPREAEAMIKPFEVFHKGLTVYSSYTSRRNSISALRMMQTGRILTDPLVSHRIEPAEFADAMEWFAQSRPDVMKVQVVFS